MKTRRRTIKLIERRAVRAGELGPYHHVGGAKRVVARVRVHTAGRYGALGLHHAVWWGAESSIALLDGVPLDEAAINMALHSRHLSYIRYFTSDNVEGGPVVSVELEVLED